MQELMCLVSSQDEQLRQKKRMMREATSGSTHTTCPTIPCSTSVKGWPPGSGPGYRAERRFPRGEPRLPNASDCFASKRANINALQQRQASVQAVTAPAATAYDAIGSLTTRQYGDSVVAMCRPDPEGGQERQRHER
jgi:hypothetical protein